LESTDTIDNLKKVLTAGNVTVETWINTNIRTQVVFTLEGFWLLDSTKPTQETRFSVFNAGHPPIKVLETVDFLVADVNQAILNMLLELHPEQQKYQEQISGPGYVPIISIGETLDE
jgi:hypothetical protein